MSRSIACLPRSAWPTFVLTLVLTTAPLRTAWGASYYEDAQQRFDAKDYAGAIIQLKNALRKENNKLAIQFLLGRALQQEGDVIGAEVAYKEALSLGLSRTEAVVPLAQTLVAQGRQREMLSHPQLQLDGLPVATQQSLLLVRASAQADMGDMRTALITINQARAMNDQRADVWLAEVPVRLRNREFAEGLKVAERGLALAPNDAESHYVLGTVHHVQGNLGGAVAAYTKALSLNPQHVETLIALAGIQMDQGHLDQVQATLTQLKKAAPKEPRGAYLRALLAERQHKTVEARAALAEVTQLLDPVPISYVQYRPQFLMLNGLSHFGLGNYTKSRQYLEAYLKLEPGSPASRLLARIDLNDNQPKAAIARLEDFLRLHPGDSTALNLLGSAYMAQGNAPRATQILQEALSKQDKPEVRTALGLSLLKSGRTDGAITELETAWHADPTQVTAAISLAQIYASQKRWPAALALARDLVKQHPQQAGAHNLLAELLARQGQTAAARQSYEKALSLDPKLSSPQLQLARLDIDGQQLESAEKRLNALLKDQPKHTDAMAEMARIADHRGQGDVALRWLIRARDASSRTDLRWDQAVMELHMRLGKPQEALAAGKLALDKQPSDVTTLLMYARAQMALDDMPGARATLNNATRFAEYDAPQQTEIARLQVRANNLTGAAYSLNKALTDTKDYTPAQALLVQVEARQGDLDKAEQRAQQIVAAQPQKALGHQLLGDLALARKNPGAALAAYRQAYKVEPNSGTAVQLINALAAQNQPAEAQELARQRLKQTPNDVAIMMAMGDIHARAARYADATTAYKAALKVQPNNLLALNNLANAQIKAKDPGARQTATTAHKLNPQNPVVVDTLGWVMYQQGEIEQALPLLRDARLRAPGNPEIRYHLAKVLAATGRKQEARTEVNEALKVSTQFDGASDAQALLNSLK